MRKEVQNVRESMLRKEKMKKLCLESEQIYETVQLHYVKGYVTGRNSWEEKSIKIFSYYYILFVYYSIV